MICKNCYTNIEDGVKFCPKCGTAVEEAQANAQPQYDQQQQPQYQQQPQQQQYQQPPYQQYQAPQYQQQGQKPPGYGLAIASMVLGIASLVIPYGGIVTAIVGLVLGIIAKQKLNAAGAPDGMARAGIICSIVCLALSILITVLCISCICAASSATPYAW